MNLSRLVYISDATKPMSEAELMALVGACQEKNTKKGITGLLLYSGGHFIQVLEGERMTIGSLYSRIATDSRHTNAARLSFKEADTRIFSKWGMELMMGEKLAGLNRQRIERILLRLRLDRTASAASDAVALLQEFRDQMQTSAAADRSAADPAQVTSETRC